MKKILLIDDDKDFNHSLRDYLEHKGFCIVCAFDGKQGLSLIKQEKPDLIITDIVMPEVDGIELMYDLLNNPPENPINVIAISGGGRMSEKNYLNVAQELNADYVFKKPLDIDRFIDAVETLLC